MGRESHVRTASVKYKSFQQASYFVILQFLDAPQNITAESIDIEILVDLPTASFQSSPD